MGVFKTEKLLCADAALIPEIAEAIAADFKAELFDVQINGLATGGADVSVSKGGMFMAVLGLKSALKITLSPTDGGIAFSAGVGIFGQQAIPTAISLFITWPVLITQIWGMVQQSKLDDRALAAAERCIAGHADPDSAAKRPQPGVRFCTQCGTELPKGARFCPGCGGKA